MLIYIHTHPYMYITKQELLIITGEFPFAKCFVCGEMGHLSRSCPDNPKGLYADGEYCYSCMLKMVVSYHAVVI